MLGFICGVVLGSLVTVGVMSIVFVSKEKERDW